VIIRKVRSTATESSIGLTALLTQANSLITTSMVKESTPGRMDTQLVKLKKSTNRAAELAIKLLECSWTRLIQESEKNF